MANHNSSSNYGDYSQYSGYQSGSYDTTTPITTATTPGYNYGYNYSQAGYSGYNSYSGQYGYNQNYDYNNYSGYYTTTTTTPTAQTPISSGVGNPSEGSHVSGNRSYGSSGSNLPAPPPPPAVTGSSPSAWGGYYNTAQSSNTSGYNQQTGYSANQPTSSGSAQNQSASASGPSWNPQGYGNQSQTNVQDGAGTQQSYQTQTHDYSSQPLEGQYQSEYRKHSYNEHSSDYDNSSNNASYYSGVHHESNYDNEHKPFSNIHGGNDKEQDKFNNTESKVSDSYSSNDRGFYKNQYNNDDKDPGDEYDARNYRDTSINRNDRSRGGRGRGFQGRGRGHQGSGFHGLKGQWSEDNGHDQNYGQRLNSDDCRGGRGSSRGLGRGRGNVFSCDKPGFEMKNSSNRNECDSGNRGWNKGGFGRGDNRGRNRGGFRGGYESSRGIRGGNDHSGFSRGGGRGDRGGTRGGPSKLGQESGFGRGRGSCTDSKESSSNVIDVSDYKPWTNTAVPGAELKRKPEPVLTTAAKKKKEEEVVDVMPFIQTHIEEHCTVNEDARKLAEESLKKMMQPAYCVLCNARMSGAPQAKMHYQGKNHNKKIKNFITGGMTKYAEKVKEDANKTKEQLEKERLEEEERNRLLDQQVEEGARRVRENLMHLANLEASHIPDMETHSSPAGIQMSGSIVDSQNPEFCPLCTVEFSSAQQAEQHYQGKNHKKRLKHIGPGAEELGQFVCELCNVRVTTQEILNQHLNGAKHKSKASRETDTKDYIVPDGGLVVEGGTRLKPGFTKGRGGNSNAGLDWPSKPRANIDYSNFRTPSGKYYCPMCDVTMNTEAHFAQHSQSRTHRQKNLDKKYQDLNEKS